MNAMKYVMMKTLGLAVFYYLFIEDFEIIKIISIQNIFISLNNITIKRQCSCWKLQVYLSMCDT